jgi:hypothetical protein
MRLPILSPLLIFAVLLGEMDAASSQSPASYKEQCQGATSGVGTFCFANPFAAPASNEAMNVPRPPGGERYQPGEPGRPVGARQSPVVRAKQSASTGERSPGGRLDIRAAGAQVPKQGTRSFPSEDELWPMSGPSTVR